MRILSTITEVSLKITPGDFAYHLSGQSGSGYRPYFCFLDSSLVPDKYSKYSYIAPEPAFVLCSHGYRNEFINTSLNIRYDSYCHPLVFLKKNLNDFILHLPGQKKNIRTFYISGNNMAGVKEFRETVSPLSIVEIKGTAGEGKHVKTGGEPAEVPLPGFRGGFVGYFAYELKDYIEKLPCSTVDDLKLPIIYLAYYNRVLAFDHERQKWLYIRNFIITGNDGGNCRESGSSMENAGEISNVFESYGNNERSKDKIPEVESYGNMDGIANESVESTVFSGKDILRDDYNIYEVLGKIKDELAGFFPVSGKRHYMENIKENIIGKYLKKNTGTVKLKSNFSKRGYLDGVIKTKKYIYKGDIYQANFSQRFGAELQVEPMDLYYILREKNAAPFSAYLGFPGFVIGSSSPERFLYLKGDVIETRPIKGTRPRGRDHGEDLKLARELQDSIKDRAELNMIVDLERNDLGKFCYYGTVGVCEHAVIEKYARVFHSVSTVRGKVKEGTDMADIIRATFPGGSITGAPKIRAMEIIDELEPTVRSVYTGSIGYIGIDNTVDLNIVIRTFIIKGGRFYYNVGGGIVADSDPGEEFRETMDKGSALQNTLRFFEARNLKKSTGS
ncbi:MAG: anthranilate synthase component I family protein [Actinobacteria bacterium]|nr:anthranilate synthase component I family protein [Actinomycetota bacterium]